MKKHFYIILLISLLPLLSVGQHARINITSGYLKIGASGNGVYSALNLTQTYFVIDNNQTTALTATAGSAGIITEAEFNMVQWNVGTATGTFTLPFVYTDLTAIPVTATISVAGTNTGSGNAAIEFSTWDTQPDNANGTQSIDGMPFDVTNLDAEYLQSNPQPSATDDSYNVVDRFWIVDTKSSVLPSGITTNNKFSAAPTIGLTFYYLNSTDASSEVSLPNVQPMDGQLIPQRFNSTAGQWGDYLPGISGSNLDAGKTGYLSSAAVTSANWFRSWTLVNMASPLPIKLISFLANCENGNAELKWSTATEANNDYFTIARSSDGVTFQTIAIVKGSGNSSTTLNYSTIDQSPLFGTSYYRLSQTDLDGTTVIAGTVSYTSCANESYTTINGYATDGYVNIQVNSVEKANATYTIMLCNALGQTVLNTTETVVPGSNEFKVYPAVAEGIYFLNIDGSENVYHKKIIIKK